MRDFLLAEAERTGIWPHSLATEPQLEDGNQLIWEAFAFTSASRSTGTRFSKDKQYIVNERIAFSEIVAFCDFYDIDDLEQRRRVVRIVQAMDQAYLDAVNPKVK